MSLLTAECPRCHRPTRVPVSSLLVFQLIGGEAPGSVAYICEACHELVDERASEGGLVVLRAGGCEINVVSLREPYPEQRPADRRMTLDDVIELYADVAAIEGGTPVEDAP